jgi:hypothetical protein
VPQEKTQHQALSFSFSFPFPFPFPFPLSFSFPFPFPLITPKFVFYHQNSDKTGFKKNVFVLKNGKSPKTEKNFVVYIINCLQKPGIYSA